MRTTGRRRLDMFWIGLGVAGLGGLAAAGAAFSNLERIERIWTVAELREDGTSTISEVIDYNFGNTPERHGIFRIIPGVPSNAVIQVASPDAPADIASQTPDFLSGEAAVNVKIGDPNITISGRHRYLLRYEHRGIQGASGNLAWDAVGTGWEHEVEQVEAHVIAPWEFVDARCDRGRGGETGGCTVEQPEPGHLIVVADGLASGVAVTLYAEHGSALATAPEVPDPPAGPPADDGAGIAMPAAFAAVAGAGGGLTMSRFVRRRGRERVGTGGVADAAWAGGGGPTANRLVDAEELAEMATTDFAPPEGLTAPMGGIILFERVTDDHRTAWLIEAAIQGAVELDETNGDVRLTRTAPGDSATRPILDSMFGGRDQFTLGKYDSTFARGWGRIGSLLEGWSNQSGMWDPAGDKRRTTFRVLGVLGAILGVALVVAGGVTAAMFGEGYLPLVVVGGLIAGMSWAAIIRSWELRVRSVEGSARWLRIESFRRFLAGSEAFHAEEAAKRGMLREYTAWAVAVGEVGRWSKACGKAAIAPSTAGLGYAVMAPHLASAASRASTAPSSSSGGGGGGGGAGGGGGGGGGGSW